MKMEGLEIEKLKRAFEAFSSASEQLSRYYKRLEDRVRALSAELQVKNRLLEGVFSCMREPLMVVDSTGKVVLFNARAKSLFGDTLKEGTYFEELGIAFGQEIKISDGWFIPERFKLDEQTEVVLLKDITLIKEMEQERQKLKRLEAMGQALATVVHELRNPLCSIELYASMLLEELRGTELESLAKGVSEGVRNMDSFLANALYFAKPRKPKLSKTTLREVVHEVLQLLRPMMEGTGLKLTIELSDRTILADRSLLKQVLLNIFINAIQAMNTEGRIEVKDEQKEGEYLVKIKDTGPGIDESILENIFDPFFTTKPEGTGLGLSISLKIMQLHGGGIRVKSTPGEGSEFVLYFPDSNRTPVNGTTEKTEEAQSNGNNTGGV